MGLKERFGRAPEERPELSEMGRRERAAARAERREARRAGGPAAKRIGAAGAGVLGEAGKVVLEVFVLVWQAWLALAELAGRFVLAVWLVVFPLVVAAGRTATVGLRVAQRRIEPAHGTLAVAVAALAVLVVSQFFDYRGISVGTSEYSGGVELVAPAPEVSRERTGDAHAWLVIPIAAAGLVAVLLAVLGRPGVARLLVPAGVAVLAIAVFVDMPKGLDEGAAAVAYEGARAGLLEGFWAQCSAAGTLIVCGILLPIHLGALGVRTGARGGSSLTRRGRARTRPGPKAASA